MNSNLANRTQSAFKNATNSMGKASTTMKVLSILAFLLVVAVGIYFLWVFMGDYRETVEGAPWIIRETRLANKAMAPIPGQIIKRSVDGQFGTEFTYCMWLFIDEATFNNGGSYKHIMHKGNDKAMPLQAPGLFIYPRTNKLAINMNTFYSVKESCDIGNIPIGKWFHLTIMLIGRNLDVYVNGRLKKRCTMKGVPKLNYGDLYVSQWGGFNGFISRMRYFNYAIPFYKIEQMVNQGPSDAPCTETGETPPYFSSNWWFGTGFPDAPGFPTHKEGDITK